MERLTIRNSEGIGVLKQPFECERCGDLQWSLPDLGNGSPIDRLAEYEDFEEQGLLLKLPCKVGDTVYVFLPNDNHFTVAQIDKIEIKPTLYGKMCYFIEPVSYRGHLYRFFENDFGKTVFLTQAEAEKALKEMEGKNE